MRNTTAEELKQACHKHKIERVNVRQCSICNGWIGYVISGDSIAFDSGCDCVSYGGWMARTWQDAAECVNMQTDFEVKKTLAAKFGVDLEKQPELSEYVKVKRTLVQMIIDDARACAALRPDMPTVTTAQMSNDAQKLTTAVDFAARVKRVLEHTQEGQ